MPSASFPRAKSFGEFQLLDAACNQVSRLLTVMQTWNGQLGFQTQPSTPFIVDIPDLVYQAAFDASHQKGRDDVPQGQVGILHYERGLMWAQTFAGTHTQPESQPRACYRHLQ